AAATSRGRSTATSCSSTSVTWRVSEPSGSSLIGPFAGLRLSFPGVASLRPLILLEHRLDFLSGLRCPLRLGAGVTAVRLDDLLDDLVPHHVLRIEVAERHAVDACEDLLDGDQAGLGPRREVDLCVVARDDGPGAEAEAREEHLHLLPRGVL